MKSKTQNLLIAMLLLFLPLSFITAQEKQNSPGNFEFAFITDIHLRHDRNAPKGFQMLIDSINKLNPDFVLTGGDLVYDVLRGNKSKSDSLFGLYKTMVEGFNMPVYHCPGNHDLFAIYPESPEEETHPDYKYGMFERHLGKTYYSFNHKGWHFIVLNSLEVTSDNRYKGFISNDQMEWLRSDLDNVDKTMPVVVVSHIPLITTWAFVNGGGGTRSVENSSEVFELLEGHQLKLVLQGHIHWIESGKVNQRFWFITGGAVAGDGWKGRRHNTREGFIYVSTNKGEVNWEYLDYGWERERLKSVGK